MAMFKRDNVLAEFNVNPARTEAEFIENTLLILSDLVRSSGPESGYQHQGICTV